MYPPKNTLHIEGYRDQYWMNSVELVLSSFPKPSSNGITGIGFVTNVNFNWPSRKINSKNVFDGIGNCKVEHKWPDPITKFGYESFDAMI